MRKKVYLVEQLNDRGDFQELDYIDSIFKKIEILLLTPKNTHPFDPEYGNNLLRLLFDIHDDTTLENIENEIKELVSEITTDAMVELDTKFTVNSNRNGFVSKISISVGNRTKNYNLYSNGTTLNLV